MKMAYLKLKGKFVKGIKHARFYDVSEYIY